MTDTEFANECSLRFGNHTSREWLIRLCSTRILFLDDLGKAAPTERYRHELDHVIEQRTAWGRPMFVTTNFNGEELAGRLGDAGAAIVGRLREFCEIIPFPSQSSTKEKI
jgi:DNA replication protein DnaC